jgi:adenine-specific DNA-methyltransferase
MAKSPLKVETLTHDATRKNAPTAELEPLMEEQLKAPLRVAYERRNPDLDPQLVWRGKDVLDWSDLVVNAPPLYIQEKIHPKALIEDLKRASERRKEPEEAPDLFADFNGLDPEARTEFYQHDQHWSNRMILGDSLQVMASLAEREGLKGQVQCIYIDPPYGIKFNSNFQWSTTSRDVKDGKADHLTREPEQVKAFRDTWRDGIHSYLTYLRDRLTVARDLLTESGSIFVQIGDENVHRVRALMDEVFGDNCVAQISTQTSGGSTGSYLGGVVDYILWYAKSFEAAKYRPLAKTKAVGEEGAEKYTRAQTDDLNRVPLSAVTRADPGSYRVYRQDNMTSQSVGRDKGEGAASWFPVTINGREIRPSLKVRWKTNEGGMERLLKAGRVESTENSLAYVRFLDDFAAITLNNSWSDIGGVQSRADPKVYVVQSPTALIERCMLMTTDPGDLVLDPTCGSGTTAFVAEQWGRRWITVDTSRVALALARARIMGARYPWYLLADSREGQIKEGEIARTAPKDTPTHDRVRLGFVYKRVPHITLKSIANNAEIDTIWDEYQQKLEPLREALNAGLGTAWQEWEIPRELPDDQATQCIRPELVEALPFPLEDVWKNIPSTIPEKYRPRTPPNTIAGLHSAWWTLRIARQKEIDASIAAKAETEYLYDQPYTDSSRIRVAGPFTVESLSPHRVPAVDIDDTLFDELEAADGRKLKAANTGNEASDFATTILAALAKAGVQQHYKDERIKFDAMHGWPGQFVCAEGQFTLADGTRQRAGILVGPEYGTVARDDLMAAARECADAGFDLLIACAFNYDAHASEVERLGRLTILKARINPDLHMPELADTGAGNLFTVFGEPDIRVHDESDGLISVEVAGVDMFKGGQIESSSAEDIAVWFVDTDYNYESFFVRHAYFPSANDPYKALKSTLKAEIDEYAWASLKRTRSRPVPKPESGQVAVKVINHLGDEVMKVVAV